MSKKKNVLKVPKKGDFALYIRENVIEKKIAFILGFKCLVL